MKLKTPPTPLILDRPSEVSADPSPAIPPLAEVSPLPPIPSPAAPSPAAPAQAATRAERLPLPARLAYPAAAVLSLGWAAAATAFAVFYKSAAWRFDFTPVQIGLLAAVVILPVLLIALGAYTLRQSGHLILETRRARAATDAMVAPAVRAAGEAGDVVAAVRIEIARAAEMAASAMTELGALRAALAEDTARLQEITTNARAAASQMTETLTRERQEMGALSDQLDQRATTIGETITRQTDLVAQASDLAQTQLREAEASLASRAAELAAAAGDAAEISSLAGQQLSLNADHLRTVSDAVSQQMGSASTNLSRERAQFEALEITLRTAQADLVERLARERTLIIEAVAQGRVGSQDISATAVEVSGSLRELIADVEAQLTTLSQTARSEQALIDSESRAGLRSLAELGRETRSRIETEGRETIQQLAQLAEETRTAARTALDEATSTAFARIQSARETLEQLGELAFTSGQTADAVYDSRIAAARRLIEESTRLVTDAGTQTSGRIEASLAAAKAAAAELKALMDGVDERARKLPGPGSTVGSSGATAYRSSGSDTPLEAQVSQTVASLSETARLISDASHGDARPVADSPPPTSAPPALQTPVPPTPAPHEAIHVPADAADDDEDEDGGPPLSFEMPPIGKRAPRSGGAAAPPRPRLRLTMTDQDRDVKTVFEPVRPDRPRREPGDLRTWRDILKKMADGTEGGDDALPNRLRTEVEALGVDPAALLPRGRIDEISRSLGDGDLDAGRATVRRLAPAAVRRLARRMDSDEALKDDARKFVGRFGSLVVEALSQDQAAASGLLGSDQGRVFLLLDASVGPAA